MRKNNPLRKFGQFDARSEANTALVDDEVVAILKLVTSGFSGLLIFFSASVFSNLEKFLGFRFWVKCFVVAYCIFLVLDIFALSLATIQAMVSRSLHRRMVAYDAAGIPMPEDLLKAFDIDHGALGANGLRSLVLSCICLSLLPVLIGVCLFSK